MELSSVRISSSENPACLATSMIPQPPHRLLGEAALPADALGRGQEPLALVEADRGDADSRPLRDLSDAQLRFRHEDPLDLNLG